MATQFDINLIKNTLFIDIGNSRLKYSIDEYFDSIDYNSSNFNQLFEAILKKNSIVNIYLSSVNSIIEQIVFDFAIKYSIKTTKIENVIESQTIIDFMQVENMGIDRKLGLLGALTYCQSPLITIDCGTALTINYLNEVNICKGGVIFAGLHTQLKALSDVTDKLKNYEFFDTKDKIGLNTKDALSLGVLYSIIGGIKEFFHQNNLLKEKINVIITGGYSETIFSVLSKSENSVILKKNLVLDGIIYLISNQKL